MITTAQKPTATIQALASLPRTYVRNGQEHKTRKRFPTWVTVGRFPVLYCDSKVIIVRQFWVESIYNPDGSPQMSGYNLGHPGAPRVPYKPKAWRIAPQSVERLRGTRTISVFRKPA